MGQCSGTHKNIGAAVRPLPDLKTPATTTFRFAPALLAVLWLAAPDCAWAADSAAVAWWVWPIALFIVTFLLGVVAILGGVGGGVLFVPIVSGFFPFHLDFVRGAGLLLALCGALAAGPQLLRSGMASLRLGMPLALVGSITSIFGALLGLKGEVQSGGLRSSSPAASWGPTVRFGSPSSVGRSAVANVLGGGLHSEPWRARCSARSGPMDVLHAIFAVPSSSRGACFAPCSL